MGIFEMQRQIFKLSRIIINTVKDFSTFTFSLHVSAPTLCRSSWENMMCECSKALSSS